VLVAKWIIEVIHWGSAVVGLFAFVHALLQRADAYSAADRKTKPIWMLITGAATLAMVLFYPDPFGPGMFFWVPAAAASLVYLVDVRPRLIEVQRGGGHRW
jgi:NADH:ubiquinone oxidoreductase subunit 6 (subunit J)